jgi:RNA polymerase sigma factor
MLTSDKNEILQKIKEGNDEKRNQFIVDHQSFILSRLQFFLKRKVDHSHELYTEAMIAFNEAIEKYDMTLGTSFYSFAETHMRFRLLDYLKREKKHHHTPLELETEDGQTYSPAELEKVKEQYERELEKERRDQAFQIFIAKLRIYGIEPHILSVNSPKHTDTKEMLQKIIEKTSENEDFLSYLKHKQKLPIRKIAALTGIPKKTIENHRRYIIAHLLILTEKELFPLRHFLHS